VDRVYILVRVDRNAQVRDKVELCKNIEKIAGAYLPSREKGNGE
jgi:hypothetical protein